MSEEINHVPSDEEPEMVKAMSARMMSAENGDVGTVIRIYNDFRWGIKKAAMIGKVNYRDIDVLLDAAIKRCRKQVKDAGIQAKAVLKFEQAKAKLSEFLDDEMLREDVCPLCQLPRFICSHNTSEGP